MSVFMANVAGSDRHILQLCLFLLRQKWTSLFRNDAETSQQNGTPQDLRKTFRKTIKQSPANRLSLVPEDTKMDGWRWLTQAG